MAPPLPRKSRPGAPRYPALARPVLAGVSAALLGAAALAGCGRSDTYEFGDDAEQVRAKPQDSGTQPQDSGPRAPDASRPDPSDFFGGGAPAPLLGPDGGWQ